MSPRPRPIPGAIAFFLGSNATSRYPAAASWFLQSLYTRTPARQPIARLRETLVVLLPVLAAHPHPGFPAELEFQRQGLPHRRDSQMPPPWPPLPSAAGNDAGDEKGS